jgi:hypothetical protein
VSTEDARNVAIILIIAIAPLAIVLIVALLRSYTVSLHMTRDEALGRRRPRRGGGPDEE